MNLDLKCPLTPEQLEQAKVNMLDYIWDWVLAKYPAINLATVERNLATFCWIKKYDDACKNCMSTQMCPSQDGNRANGKLMPDGVVSVWMEPCPNGYRLPRQYEPEQQQSSGWRKRQ